MFGIFYISYFRTSVISKQHRTVLSSVRETRIRNNQHRGALRGIPGSVCPQPEPNATELPSCAPISARTAQRQGGGGVCVARRACAARAPKPTSCATSFGASSAPFAASFTCPPFTCRAPLPLGLPHQQRASDVQRARDNEETADEETLGARGWGQFGAGRGCDGGVSFADR